MDNSIFILECLNAGILPPAFKEKALISESPQDFLAQLPPEESRRFRRKFRKLHRKIKKNQARAIKELKTRKGLRATGRKVPPERDRMEFVDRNLERINIEFGHPGKQPDSWQKRHRRSMVMQEIWKKIPRN